MASKDDKLDVAVVDALREMYQHYRKPLEAADLLVWQRLLRGYRQEAIRHAISAAMLRSGPFCPVVGTVVEIMHECGERQSASASPYGAAWYRVLAQLEAGRGVAAQQMINAMDEQTRRAMCNRFSVWAEQRVNDEGSWSDLTHAIDDRCRQRTDGQLGFYFYSWLDDMPFIVRWLNEAEKGAGNANGQ